MRRSKRKVGSLHVVLIFLAVLCAFVSLAAANTGSTDGGLSSQGPSDTKNDDSGERGQDGATSAASTTQTDDKGSEGDDFDVVAAVANDGTLKNIFGAPLAPCPDAGGSDWNSMCSESSNAVHAICMTDMPAGFSAATGQSGWSVGRAGHNHCVGIGAFALFVAKGHEEDANVLCSAVPAFVLDPKYASIWGEWNGLERPGQAAAGVNHLFEFCLTEAVAAAAAAAAASSSSPSSSSPRSPMSLLSAAYCHMANAWAKDAPKSTKARCGGEQNEATLLDTMLEQVTVVAAPLNRTIGAFEWEDAPLSSPIVAGTAAAGYLATVAALRSIVPKGGWAKIRGLIAIHNIVLCLWSLVMFVGCLIAVMDRIRTAGGNAEWLVCEDPKAKARGALYFWSYIYYLSKYYELLDTILAIINGSNVPHLPMHVYHHTMVLPMSWLWLHTCQSLQFGGLLFNTFVHVIMYYYYYLKARYPEQRVWWKNWITRLQIVQFVTSLILLLVTCSRLSAAGNIDGCAGMSAVAFNTAFNMTLLQQFFGVLQKNQKNDNSNKKAERKGTAASSGDQQGGVKED